MIDNINWERKLQRENPDFFKALREQYYFCSDNGIEVNKNGRYETPKDDLTVNIKGDKLWLKFNVRCKGGNRIRINSFNIDSEEKNRLISEILNEFLKLDSENYYKKDLEYYREKSIVLGRNIMYIKNGEEKKAYVREINEKGNLVVINEKGEESVILSGEIRLGIDNIL